MTLNLVGDKWDTQAGKIVADAELDEMRGSVIANLCDEIASALRDIHAEREEAVTAAIAEGYAKGVEDSAKIADKWGLPDEFLGSTICGRSIANSIRALVKP